MSTGLAGKWEQRRSLRWVWPLNLAKYDQAPTLREDERTTIENIFEGSRRREFAREPWRTQLSRLLTPILDLVSVLLNEMWCRNSSYWSWKESDWESMLRISTRTYSRVHGVRGDARSHLLAFALLLRRIHDPRQCGEFDRILLAKRVFGEPRKQKTRRPERRGITRAVQPKKIGKRKNENVQAQKRRRGGGPGQRIGAVRSVRSSFTLENS
jgi:hypothetical protein